GLEERGRLHARNAVLVTLPVSVVIIEVEHDEIGGVPRQRRSLERRRDDRYVRSPGLECCERLGRIALVELGWLPHQHMALWTDHRGHDLGPVSIAAEQVDGAHPALQSEELQD